MYTIMKASRMEVFDNYFLEGDGCTPSLSKMRKDALQGGREALQKAEGGISQ